MNATDQQKLWDAVRKQIESASDYIHDSTQWYCDEWYDGNGSVMNALVEGITTMFADHYEQQLAASRAEAAQWRTELVKSSDEISQALERGWLNPVAAKNLTADLAAKERECERLRELYRAERSKMGAWFRHKAETEANIKAAAGGEGSDERE